MPRLRVRLLRYGLLAPLSALIATALHATPPTWAGGGIDNKASNPLNWALGNLTLSVAPGNSDQVVVSTGSVLFDANTTYGALTFSGGNLNGSSTLTLGSLASSNWSGGNMTFSSGGGVAVSTGATLAISGTGTDHDFSATALTNSGTVNWTGGRLRSGYGGTFTNNGVFNDTASSTVNNDLGGTALVFSNGAGAQYNKSAAGTTEFDIALNNSGSVKVSSGELYLHGGGSSSGTFTVTGVGNDIRIDNGYTFSAGTTLSGLVRFGGGTITANGNIVADGLSIEGGSLQGSQAFSGGTISWTGGDWNETGASTSLGSSTTLGIGGTSDHDFSGRAISNTGTVNWSSGRLRSGNGGSFTNYATFNDKTATSTDINNELGGATATFTNTGDGTFSKYGSGTTRFYDVTFNNSGTVNVHAGTLELHGGGTNAALATIAADAGANVVFSNDYTLADGSSLTGGGNFSVTGGTLTANGDFFVALNNNGTLNAAAGEIVLHSGGTFGAGAIFTGVGTTQLVSGTFTAKGAIQTSNLVLAGGTLNGNSLLHGLFEFASGLLGSGATTTVDSDGAMTIDSTADHDLPGSSLINNGVIKWNGGTIRGGDAASITNNGTFIDYASSAINNDYGGTLLTFTNSATGVYAKAGAGTTTVSIPFTNNGTLAVTAGTIVFNGTFTNNGSLIFANGGVAQIANPISFPSAGTLAGNGTLNVSSVIAGGLVSPGTSPGQLNVSGDLTLLSTSLLLIELGGTTQGTTYDFLNVGGNVTLGGNLSIQFANGFSNSVLPTNIFTVLTANGTSGLTGAFANVANGQRLITTDGLGSFQVNYGAGLNSVTLTNFVAVPEPSTYALFGFGVAMLSVAAWRRKRKA